MKHEYGKNPEYVEEHTWQEVPETELERVWLAVRRAGSKVPKVLGYVVAGAAGGVAVVVCALALTAIAEDDEEVIEAEEQEL